jgi:antitoxin PrlF
MPEALNSRAIHGLLRRERGISFDRERLRWYYLFVKVRRSLVLESALTSKGQATIPKAVREYLNLKAGDRVRFFFHPDGSVALLPRLPVTALRGIVKSRRVRPVTIEQMNEAIAEGATGVRSHRRK